jgi:hypothetical protein
MAQAENTPKPEPLSPIQPIGGPTTWTLPFLISYSGGPRMIRNPRDALNALWMHEKNVHCRLNRRNYALCVSVVSESLPDVDAR